jgi:hypothetical protein
MWEQILKILYAVEVPSVNAYTFFGLIKAFCSAYSLEAIHEELFEFLDVCLPFFGHLREFLRTMSLKLLLLDNVNNLVNFIERLFLALIDPNVLAIPALFAIDKLSIVNVTIVRDDLTLTMPLVVLVASRVNSTLSLCIFTETFSFVVIKTANVDPIVVHDSAYVVTFKTIEPPSTTFDSTIGPGENTKAVTLLAKDVASVGGAVFHLNIFHVHRVIILCLELFLVWIERECFWNLKSGIDFSGFFDILFVVRSLAVIWSLDIPLLRIFTCY